ncbi:hypothetical protein DPMN_118752 [Dreissena polymorpha]|uniref:Uncharacterized protein n=1 Tax=Dreissena polymorpha TaxID=45954 RepID=A0A9D4JM69_DREPO|nr:hypothetical protein DPMN_118752 [Dreissena polymorpha]
MIIATGMGKTNAPVFDGIQYVDTYEDMSLNTDDYEGKTVLILSKRSSDSLNNKLRKLKF